MYVLQHVFKSLNGNVPVSITNNFSYIRNIVTVFAMLITVEHTLPQFINECSLAYNRTVTWNKLPLTVRSLQYFQHNYKVSVLHNMCLIIIQNSCFIALILQEFIEKL